MGIHSIEADHAVAIGPLKSGVQFFVVESLGKNKCRTPLCRGINEGEAY